MICLTNVYYEQAFPDSLPPCDTCKRKNECFDPKPKAGDEIYEQQPEETD